MDGGAQVSCKSLPLLPLELTVTAVTPLAQHRSSAEVPLPSMPTASPEPRAPPLIRLSSIIKTLANC